MSKNVHQAVLEVMKEVSGVTKDAQMKAGKFSYKYTSAEAMIEAVRPAMIRHALVLYPIATSITSTTYSTQKGANMFMAQGTVTYTLAHAPSDTSTELEVACSGSDSGDKFSGKAMTMAYKYALRQVFALPQNDDDPDATSSEAAPSQPNVRDELQWHQLTAQAPKGMTEDERIAWVGKVNHAWKNGDSYGDSVTDANRAYSEYKDKQ